MVSNLKSKDVRSRIEVLLVEDSAAQALLVKTFMEPPLYLIRTARDGIVAMQFLRREGEFSEAARPDLVLLDINMPHKDGFEVLSEVKADPELRQIPIIMFSTSDEKNDIQRAYDSGANSYIEKPPSIDELQAILKNLANYWGRTSKLPSDDFG